MAEAGRGGTPARDFGRGIVPGRLHFEAEATTARKVTVWALFGASLAKMTVARAVETCSVSVHPGFFSAATHLSEHRIWIR